ncbi:MAG: prenyltransferase [Candidatus Aminicenantes bacterium]|nr:prenyltransferase [Candidatus Aminicenantes bacterium]
MNISLNSSVPLWKKWLIAARPWALPASIIPVCLGTLLALIPPPPPFHFWRFLLALLAMVFLHFAANMRSDVSDFKLGLDKEVTPVSGAIVRGWLSSDQVLKAAIFLFIMGCLIGLILVTLTGPALLIIGFIGVLIGASYPYLKARALGDLAVFLNFGVLGSLGAWFVQTEKFSLWPGLWAIPQALLVVAILHANNWRDIVTDKEKKVFTVASLLGDRGSMIYYTFLIFLPFFLVMFYVFGPRKIMAIFPPLPYSFLLVFLSLPAAFLLWQRAKNRHHPRRPLDFIILDGATSQFNWLFGFLSLVGLGLDLI